MTVTKVGLGGALGQVANDAGAAGECTLEALAETAWPRIGDPSEIADTGMVHQ